MLIIEALNAFVTHIIEIYLPFCNLLMSDGIENTKNKILLCLSSLIFCKQPPNALPPRHNIYIVWTIFQCFPLQPFPLYLISTKNVQHLPVGANYLRITWTQTWMVFHNRWRLYQHGFVMIVKDKPLEDPFHSSI